MALEFTPSDSVNFQRPLIHTNKAILLLKNDNAEAVIFRIKTTAPNQYCFRPSVGRIDAFDQLEVEIFLKPFKAEPPVYFHCKDKFLVESALIQQQYNDRPTAEIWNNLEYQNGGVIHQNKFKCNFSPSLPPAEINPVAATSKSANLQHSKHPSKMYELATESSALPSQQYSAQDKPQPPVPTTGTTSSRSNHNSSFAIQRARNSAVDDMNKTGAQSVSPSIIAAEGSTDDANALRSKSSYQGRQPDDKLRQQKRYLPNLSFNPSNIDGAGKSSVIRLLQPNTTGASHPEIMIIMCLLFAAVLLFAFFF